VAGRGGHFILPPSLGDLDPKVRQRQQTFAARIVIFDDGFTDHLADLLTTLGQGSAGRHCNQTVSAPINRRLALMFRMAALGIRAFRHRGDQVT
jgi:hypothetical protein